MIWFPTKSRLRTSLSAQHSLANTDDVTNPMRSPRLNNNKVIWEGWGGCGGCCRREREGGGGALCFTFHLQWIFSSTTPPAHPHLSSPPPPPSRSFSTITCLLRHIGGDVQQTLNAELKSLDAAAYVCDTQSSKSTHTYGTADTPPESFKSCRLWINMTKQIIHHISKQHGRLCNWNMKCSSIFCAIEKSIKWNVSGICMTFTTINSRRQ